MFSPWFRGVTSQQSRATKRQRLQKRKPRSGNFRPRIEALEDRVVPATVDLALTKTASAATVAPGQLLTYTLNVVNNGPNATTTGATVTDALPTGLTFVSATTSQGTVTQSGGTVTATLGNLANAGTATVTINAMPNTTATTTTVTNSGTVAVGTGDTDSDTTNNTGSAAVTVNPAGATAADLSVVKTASASAATPGQPLTYTITVSDLSTANPATGSVLTDVL